MPTRAFLLVGGQSSRMGHDKALLPFRGSTLLQAMATRLQQITPNVVLLGDPHRYGSFGYPVWPDQPAPEGPLTAIFTALEQTDADWNLVLAIDLPAFPVPALQTLLHLAASSPADAVIPQTPARDSQVPSYQWHPLAAVYHRRAAQPLRTAWLAGERAPKRAISALTVLPWTTCPPSWLLNCNTEKEWQSFLDQHDTGSVPPLHRVPARL